MRSKSRIAVYLLVFVLVVCALAGLSSCSKECKHEWQDATCTAPKTCKLCSITEGAALGHKGGTATCTEKAVCTACGTAYGETTGHTYNTETVKAEALKTAATCEAAAVYYKSCACGAVSTNAADVFTAGELAAHVYDQSVESDAALKTAGSCTQKAVYYKSCVCGAISTADTDTFEGSALAHTYDQEMVDDTTLKAAATCESAAIYYKSCSCGAISDTVTFTFGEALPHTYDRETVDAKALKAAATCEAAAVYYKSCACGAVSNDASATFTSGTPTPHTYDQEIVDEDAFKAAATCTSAAVYYKSCACGLVSTADTDVFTSGDALPHSYDEETTPATCGAAAVTTYTCACGDVYTETVGDALGHLTTGVTPVEELVAGCEYVLVYTCQRADCGVEVEGEHVFKHNHVAAVTKDATCKEVGVKTLTCACGDTKTEDIPVDATGHDWVLGTAASGKRTDTCGHCGEERSVVVADGNSASANTNDLKDAEIELKVDAETNAGIKLDEGVIDKIGDKNITVSADKLSDEAKENLGIDEDKLAQVGDNPIYDFTMKDGDDPIYQFGENNYVTITLPYTPAEGEDVDSIAIWFINDAGELESIEATYNNGFVTFKTNHFSYYTVTRLTPAERCALYGHSHVKTVVEGNCTKDGYELYVCVRCHDTYKANEVIADGHDYESETVEATCTAEGYITYTCKDCDHSYKTKLAATGHSYEVEDTQDATCAVNGYTKYGCTACDAAYTVTHAKVMHQFENTKVAATCEGNGYTLHECKNCDYSYEDAYTPAAGHSYGEATWSWAEDYSSATATLVCEHDATHVLELKATVGVTVTHGTCSDFVKTTYTAAISHGGKIHKNDKSKETGTPNHNFAPDWKHDKDGHWHACTCGAKNDVSAHVFTDAVVTKNPTCGAEGESTSYCICGETLVTAIPATGEHTYVDGACKDCGKADTNGFYFNLIGSAQNISGIAVRVENLSFAVDEEDEDLLGQLTRIGEARQIDVTELGIYVEDGVLYGAARGTVEVYTLSASETYAFKGLIKDGYIYMQVDVNGRLIEEKYSLAEVAGDMLDGDMEEIAPVLAFMEETLLPAVESLVTQNAGEINQILGSLFDMFFTFEEQADGTFVATLDYEKLTALNENLANCSVAAVIDLYFGDGFFDAIVDRVTEIWGMKLSEVPAYLEACGLDVDALISEIDALCAMMGAPDGFTVGAIFEAEEYKDLIIGRLLFQCEDDSYMENVNGVIDMLRETSLYALINEDSEAVKEAVAAVIDMIDDSLTLTFTTDSEGALTGIGVAADDFTITMYDETYTVTVDVAIAMNDRIDVTWSDVVDEINSHLVLPEEDDRHNGVEDEMYGHWETMTYKGVVYEAEGYRYVFYRTNYDQLSSADIESDCGDWLEYWVRYNRESYAFRMMMLYDEEGECAYMLLIDECTGEIVEMTYSEEGTVFTYADGRQITVTEEDLEFEDGKTDEGVTEDNVIMGGAAMDSATMDGAIMDGVVDDGVTEDEEESYYAKLYALIFGEPVWTLSSNTTYHNFYYNPVTKEYAYMSQHDLTVTHTLKGDTCADGRHTVRTCSKCDYRSEYDAYYCETEHVEVSLADKGLCEGSYATEYRCVACGKVEDGYVHDDYCEWEYVEELENGYVERCSRCGVEKTYVYVEGEKDENCYYEDEVTYVYTLKGEEIYRQQVVYYGMDHNDEVTYEMMGTSCEDGVIRTTICKDCGREEIYETYWHSTTHTEIDLTEYGACYGYLEIYSCACGQNAWTNFNACDHSWSDNDYVDEEGKTIFVSVRSCETCGLRYETSYYVERDSELCLNTYYYTYTLSVGDTLVDTWERVSVYEEHNYEIYATLVEGATSCEEGAIYTYSCKDCGEGYTEELYWHREYEKERVELDNVCGGYAALYRCACGYYSSLDLEHSRCDWDQRYDEEWDGVACIPNGTSQYTTNGWNYYYNDFYTFTCAVTDPEACAYKIRHAQYWVAEDGCTATRYLVYQFGYDEATGACDEEIVIKGDTRTYHAYTETDIGYECADCGSYYTHEYGSYDYPADGNGITEWSREIAYNALDNGQRRYYERVYEYGYIDYNWFELRSYYKSIDSDGVEFWEEYLTSANDFVGPFGENGYERTRTYKNSDGEDYVDNAVAYTFYLGHEYVIYEYRADGDDGWRRYDYTYSFENGCVRTVSYSDSYGDSWERVEKACVYNYRGVIKEPTCSQDGLEGWVCGVCEQMAEESIISAKGHDWVWSSMGIYYCHTCGLENENGADGAIILEDLTEAYGNGEYYVVGYCDWKEIGFTHFVSLVFADGAEEIVLPEVEVFALEEVRAYAFSKAEVEALALALGYESDAYDVRFAFVPYGADGSLDYAITFAEAVTVPDVIVGETSFKAFIGNGETCFTICPEEDALWTFTSCGMDVWAYAELYDADGYWIAGASDYGFTVEYELKAGETYTLMVGCDWTGYLPLVFTTEPIAADENGENYGKLY